MKFFKQNLRVQILGNKAKDLLSLLKHSRGKKFFSETGEDSVLGNLIASKIGRYLDIGASHPVIGSNTFFLYRQGWKGIAVEPQLQFNLAWKISRPKDQIINCVVGPKETVKFYKFQNSLLSTTNRDVALSHASRGLVWKEESIESVPLSLLLPPTLSPSEEFLLNVDVEGTELECLGTIDFTQQRPRYVLVESWSLPWVKKSKALYFLEQNGYALLAYTGLTALMVPAEVIKSIRGLRQSLSEFD